jgi:hypothetical protein
MNPRKYVFANGGGDDQHALEINEWANKGYEVVTTIYNPDTAQVVVVMRQR